MRVEKYETSMRSVLINWSWYCM